MFNEEKRCKILLGLVVAIIVATIIAILLQTVPNKTTTDVDAYVETTETTTVSTTATIDTTSTSTSTTATTMTETSTTDDTTATLETVVETEVVEEEFVGPTEQQPDYNLHVQETQPFVVKETYIETTTTAVTTTVETTTVEETETVVETEVVEETANETYLGNFRITGYIADPGAKTASGTTPNSSRTIAMNKTQFKNLGLKYGDKIRVDGIGTFVLEDCGCASGRIDIFRDSVAACYALTPYADAYLVN